VRGSTILSLWWRFHTHCWSIGSDVHLLVRY
jgi:hypothetical protein